MKKKQLKRLHKIVKNTRWEFGLGLVGKHGKWKAWFDTNTGEIHFLGNSAKEAIEGLLNSV